MDADKPLPEKDLRVITRTWPSSFLRRQESRTGRDGPVCTVWGSDEKRPLEVRSVCPRHEDGAGVAVWRVTLLTTRHQEYGRMPSMNEGRKDNVPPSDRIRFCRYQPGPALSPFVRNFWTARCAAAPGASTHHRIVPDGCIDIVFVRKTPTAGYQAHVVGTMTRPIFEDLTDHPDYVGIRFAPGGFGCFFRIRPSDLTDRIVALESPPTWAVAAEQIANTDDIQGRLGILQEHLSAQFRSETQNPVIQQIVATIVARRGNVAVTELARRAAWSPRHLRRMFGESIGVGPKTFCRIVRFKDALRALRHRRKQNLLRVALDAGYYDQAHFIHEFNSFYGASPSAVHKDHRL